MREVQNPSIPGLRLDYASDADLAHLDGLESLAALYLGSRDVTDAGLEHLKILAGLQVLDLEETKVADAGLAYLKNLTALRTLNLWQTQVTDQGVRDLQRALPSCQASRSPIVNGRGP